MRITTELIENLLWSDEGPTLDFKREQYPFAGASDLEKSELLKDMLAFANSFRREDAFIVIGVEEIKGGRGTVLGVGEHIEDAHLQQFINSKVQRPMQFSYRAVEYDGLPIGIIHIPRQKRPFYAKADFGKVMKGAVYVRRGSSTSVALPDEIAAMGAEETASHPTQPELECALWDRRTGKLLGSTFSIESVVLDGVSGSSIPDYNEQLGHLSLSLFSVNQDYYRELAKFARTRLLVKPLSFRIANSGAVTAQDVRMVIDVDDPKKRLTFLDESDLPEEPRRRTDPTQFIKPAHDIRAGDETFSIERIGSVWHVECLFGKIQPKDMARLSQDLYIGSRKTMDLELEAKIFCDNLSQPAIFTCSLHFLTEMHKLSLQDIKQADFTRFIKAREALESRALPR